jgi:hypothetical protein
MLRNATPWTWSWLFVVSVAAAGCGASKTATTTTIQPTSVDDPSCPVSVPGTTVTVEDTATGAAFLFVTTGDPKLVRTRATALATMHNDMHRAMGALPDGTASTTAVAAGGHHHHHQPAAATNDSAAAAGRAMVMPMGQMISVHSRATTTNIEQGARVDFVSSPNDVAQLQNQLRVHAQHLDGGTCEM